MRRVIPANKVSHDYEKVLSEFVSALKNRLGECLLMVYLTVKETIGVGVNEKAVLRFYQTALSFTSISIFPW